MARILIFLLLSGCSVAKPPLMPNGPDTTPPWGWEDYCRRNAEDPSCER